MPQMILVPLDGSPASERALPVALSIAERARAHVTLALVHERIPPYRVTGAPPMDSRLDDELRMARSGYLTFLAEGIRHNSSIPVSTALLDGSVVEMLAEHVASANVDLVVMTTHGRGGLSRLWLGSVADGLVRRITAPILLTQPELEDDRTPPSGSFSRILIPLDGTPLAEDVLEHAIAIGGAQAEYTLLRVVPLLVTEVYLAKVVEVAHSEVDAERAHAETYLKATADRMRARGLLVDTCTLVHHHPARAILEYADESRSDLIAMAVHGKGAIGRLLVGSIADKVLRASRVPVLVHRATTEASGDDAHLSARNQEGATL